jgi:uncharacterized protein (TIGR03085 family)
VLSVSAWAQHERGVLVDLLRSLGLVVPGPVAAYTSRVMASVLRVSGYDQVLDVLAAGPPRPLRMIDEQLNLMEYFIHVEDVRRAQGSAPRSLPVGLERALFARLRMLLRLSLLRVRGIQVDVVTTHGERASFGTGPVAQLRGPVGELALWVFNRKCVADVDLTGSGGEGGRVGRARISV